MSTPTLTIEDWDGKKPTQKVDLQTAAEYVNITTDDGKVILFHVGNGVKHGIGPAPVIPTIQDVYQQQQTILSELQRKHDAPLPGLGRTAQNFLDQAKEFATTAETLGYKRVGLTETQYTELRGALSRIEAGQHAAIEELNRQVQSLPDNIVRELDRMAAVRSAGGEDLAVAMSQRTPEELAQTISELKALRVSKLSGWGYAWHITVNYILPVMALVFAAGAGLVAGGVAGFIAGRLTAPTPELEVGIDATGVGIDSGAGMDGTVAYMN